MWGGESLLMEKGCVLSRESFLVLSFSPFSPKLAKNEEEEEEFDDGDRHCALLNLTNSSVSLGTLLHTDPLTTTIVLSTASILTTSSSTLIGPINCHMCRLSFCANWISPFSHSFLLLRCRQANWLNTNSKRTNRADRCWSSGAQAS